MSSTANRIVKNTGFLYAKMGITMFISLYTTRMILNSLGASDFGIFNIVGGAIAMLGFLNAAMANATQRFMSYSEGEGNRKKQKKIFNISLILHFLISFIVGITLLIVGCFFFNGILNIPANRIYAAQVVYGSLIISTMFTIMTVPYDAVMNAHENMKYYAFVGIVESVLKLIVAFTVVYTFYDKLIVYGVLMACIPLITLSIMRVYCHKYYEECIFSPKRYWDKVLMKEMTSFAGWNFLGSIVSVTSQYGIGIVLNVFYGTIANAAQGVANQISGQLGALGSSIKKAINPVIAKSAGKQDEGMMQRSSITGTKVTVFVVTILFIPVMVDLNFILEIWLKNPPQYTRVFCYLLLITNILQDLTLFIPQAISAMGKIKPYILCTSIISLTPIVFTYVGFSMGFAPSFMYITMIIAAVGKMIIDLYYGQLLCGINALSFMKNVIARLLICMFLSMLSGCAVVFMLPPSLLRTVIIFCTTVPVYSVFFYIFGLNHKEKLIINNVTRVICGKL